VAASFMVTRCRAEQPQQMFTGRREDVLRRLGSGELRIARRRILVDQTVITGTNLSVLF
jgi:3-phenylpropionate/cinnamic acid dioxygenase small subunit